MLQINRLLCCILLALISILPAAAQQPEIIEKKVENPIGAAEQEKRALSRTNPQKTTKSSKKISIAAEVEPGESEKVDFLSDKQGKEGDVLILTGNVHATYGDMLIIADRITLHQVTNDLIAVGNVFFEQQGQRIAADRVELNTKTKRGTLHVSTAFTNRTPEGTVLIIDSTRIDKTGEGTYNFYNATLTACQEEVPKWTFTAKRARIRVDHQAKLYNALFRIKNIPIFYLPYATVPISKKDRSSGFLLPSWGSSSNNGRTLHLGYYQTLGRSADVLVRSDVFTNRGLGLGFDFRARPDEHSSISVGSFSVIDRLWGGPGPNQGGTSFYADAVQYFKNGFVAVADINITSSFDFRQIFSENILTAISPEERTIFYLNKNWRSFSFNAFFGEQSSFIFDQNYVDPNCVPDATKNCRTGRDEIVKVRQLPSVEFSQRSTKVSESLPFYFSFDSAFEGVRRSESSGSLSIFKTPSFVQRLDFFPRLTIPLPSFAGFTLTPSIGMRSTFYSDSLDPVQKQVMGQNLFRKYGEVNLDLRMPALSRVFHHGNGEPWFKHVIEPFVEYRLISGIDEFDRTLRIDERDVVARTNEITYGVSNSFLIRRTDDNGSSSQPHELLNLTLAQKYYFDPTFGGALQDGVRNQFFPINTLSGFSYGGFIRNTSPLNVRARLRPINTLWADVRMNYDTNFNALRDFIVGTGVNRGIFSFSQSWYFSRQIELDQTENGTQSDNAYYDPSSFPGNQVDFNAFVGNMARGPFGGVGLAYDLRNRRFNGEPRDRNFINLTASGGWAWDCCSFNVQRITYNAGIRNESRFIFAFTLKGIGSIGTDAIGQRR